MEKINIPTNTGNDITTDKEWADTSNCLNCGELLNGEYCSHCGQSANTRRLTFKTMVENILSGITSLDRGGFYTVIQLFIRPGKIVRDYIEGKRVEYAKPFALLAILCGLFGLASLIFYSYQGSNPGSIDPIAVSLNQFNLEDPFLRWLCGNMLFMNLLFSPIYALLTRWLFLGKRYPRYNFTEMLYLTVFWLCQVMVISTIGLPLMYTAAYSLTFTMILMLISTLLLAWIFRGLFDIGWLHAIWKSVIVSILPMFLFMIITVIIIIHRMMEQGA